MNNIVFNKGKGGLGRPLPGKDHISGLLLYSDTLPSGFSSSARIKQLFSVADAEAAGIKNDYNDETKAYAIVTIIDFGSNGDKITISFTEPNGVVEIVSYIKTSTETTSAAVASAIYNKINANTSVNGYTADIDGTDIIIYARKGLGIFPNGSETISAVTTGDLSAVITADFIGGVASLQATWYYHILEYFRQQQKGQLFVGIYPVPSSYDFTEIATMQTDPLANGAIRQIGVYVDFTTFAAAQTTALQTVANTLDALKMPLSIIYAANITSGTDIATLADLSNYTNNKVSVVIGQDNGGLGRVLYLTSGKSITILGTVLGAVSYSAVNEDIAWVGKFNLSNGVELESVGFCNGTSGQSASALDGINLKRYIFCRKFPNLAGTYLNDNHTAISQSSDYAYINDNRVIDKAIRGVDEALLPSLNSPLLLNADGTLANSTIAFLEGQALTITNDMVRNGEASAISVSIDPTQNVATTSTLTVAITIVPVGVARNIVVNIGFKTNL